MPVQFEVRQTPRGAPYLHISLSGLMSLADAEAIGAQINPGAKYHRWKLLSIAAPDTRYTPEARKYFPTLKRSYRGVAAVVTSPVVRAALNLIIRFVGDVGKVSMFRDEAEAEAWLDTFE